MAFIELWTGSFLMLKKWQTPNNKPKMQTIKPNIRRDLPLTTLPKKLTKDKSGTTKFASLADTFPISAIRNTKTAIIFFNENTLLSILIPYSILL
jgi:hypothetical protein